MNRSKECFLLHSLRGSKEAKKIIALRGFISWLDYIIQILPFGKVIKHIIIKTEISIFTCTSNNRTTFFSLIYFRIKLLIYNLHISNTRFFICNRIIHN